VTTKSVSLRRTPSLTARSVTIVTSTLYPLSAISKPRRKLVAARLGTILVPRKRVNYSNLTRYGSYSERTYVRQIKSLFPWLEYQAKMIQSTLPTTHELITGEDASFVPKGGQKTYATLASEIGPGIEIYTADDGRDFRQVPLRHKSLEKDPVFRVFRVLLWLSKFWQSRALEIQGVSRLISVCTVVL
jgi:hypothetical protein